jgi:Protein of unknown function with HXXEE motif
MEANWFYTVWPFIGIGGVLVIIPILLLTDTFRSDRTVSRWRDAVWLAWLAAPLYWIHQFEEYSLPTLGLDYSIQEMICEKIGFPPYPDCPIPLAFYPLVNIALMWVGAPLAAHLCKRNVLIGLSFWGLLFANGLVHSMGGVVEGVYNTGLLSGAILFVPLSIWVLYACAIRGPYSGKVVGVAFAAGAITHVLLFSGYGLYKAGVFGNAGLLGFAAVIGVAPIIVAALVSRFFKVESLQPVLVR